MSVVGGVVVLVWGLIKFAEFGMGVAVLQAVIMGVCTGVLCFALLQLSMKAYKNATQNWKTPRRTTMKTNKRELTVFAVCAYAVPFLMMPLLYICLQNGQDTSILPTPRCFTRRRVSCWLSCWRGGRIRPSGFTYLPAGYSYYAGHECAFRRYAAG